jgi:hypothetical protein
MRSTIVTLYGFIASSLAVYGRVVDQRQAGICSGAEGTPLCCDVDVLGVADLDCSPRKAFS